MAVNVDEDTEFNDALRKHGIIPQRPPTPPSPSPPPSPSLSDQLDDFTDSELRQLAEDTFRDDIERYWREREQREKREADDAKFGRVYPIGREDYTREVTDASDESPVVCFLYKPGLERSELAAQFVNDLALRYPHTKFVSIVGDKCIPNLPDERVPMILVYIGGEIAKQLIGWKGQRVEELEAVLMLAGALNIPTHKRDEDRGKGSRDPDSDEDLTGTVNAKTNKNVRKKEEDDEDDFEFDL